MIKLMRIFLLLVVLGGCITRYSYGIYQFDNGDDPVRVGMYRIVDEQGRIGYADESLSIIIFPQYAFGFPYSGGKAKVTYGGQEKIVPGSGGEYHTWESDEWFYIDRYGNRLEE